MHTRSNLESLDLFELQFITPYDLCLGLILYTVDWLKYTPRDNLTLCVTCMSKNSVV